VTFRSDVSRAENLPGGRCRLTATSLADSFEARDAFLAAASLPVGKARVLLAR
jgi:hypothetical protein